MENIRVTREWLVKNSACPRAKRAFLKRYPRGLTLNRRNIYKVAAEFPLSYLHWFASGNVRWQEYSPLVALAYSGETFVISPAKKRAYAKALAGVLGL